MLTCGPRRACSCAWQECECAFRSFSPGRRTCRGQSLSALGGHRQRSRDVLAGAAAQAARLPVAARQNVFLQERTARLVRAADVDY
eukprot:3421425-Pyramimonas_sp.AAC.1